MRVRALVFITYNRKEYEAELRERQIRDGTKIDFIEAMRKYDYFILNTQRVDDDFGKEKMLKFSSKVEDELLGEMLINHKLISSIYKKKNKQNN